MTTENNLLEEQAVIMEEEILIVDWYVQVLEDGSNQRQILKDYVAAKAEIERLKAYNENRD